SNKDHLLGAGPDMGIEGEDVEEIYAGANAKNVVTWESSKDWVIDGDPAAFHLTGRGVVAAAKSALESLDRSIAAATFAIEGFGQVGAGTARYLKAEGAKVAAVSTLLGGLYDPNGLDIDKLIALRQQYGDACVVEYLALGRGGERIELDKLFALSVDVLVPGA